MTKIEQAMIDAIKGDCDWHQGNTSVTFHPVLGSTEIEVHLYGHLIAKQYVTGWEINLCGWNTPTTRSRLSRIIKLFWRDDWPAGAGVSTKKNEVFLHDSRGRNKINATDWHKVTI